MTKIPVQQCGARRDSDGDNHRMTDVGPSAPDESLDDVTVWPGTIRRGRSSPVALLMWQPHVRAIALLGTDVVELGVQDLLSRGLRLATGEFGPDWFPPVVGWRAMVATDRVEVRDADGQLAVSMEAAGHADAEWRDWRRAALRRREVWLCAGPQLADPATGMPDPLPVRDRGHLVAGSAAVVKI
jgi:hypothetical protein